MKRKFTIYFLAAVALLQPSCKKFLEESSQDLIRPVTVTHYKELLQGEGYFKEIYKYGWFVDVMTDNITALDLIMPSSVENSKMKFVRPAYQWAPNLEVPTNTFQDKLFQHLYKNILTANAALEGAETGSGEETDRKVLRGQAYFHRAYGYFALANLYAQAYNEAGPDDLCVPLILETSPSLKRYNRATIRQVWDLIKSDITKAVENLASDNSSRTVYEVNYKAALLLATRIFLYMEDYDKVIEYGERFLLLHPALRNITAITTSPTTTGAFVPLAFQTLNANPEIVLTFGNLTGSGTEGGYVYYTKEATGLAEIALSASKDIPGALLNLYSAQDRRLNSWFAQPTGAPGTILSYISYTPMKVNYNDGSRTSQFMRSGEVYLNVAEALVRKSSPDAQRAVNLLNQLRRNRIASYTDLVTGDFPANDQLVTFVWEERRRELCFEEFHRWSDLRRTGQPSITHDDLGKQFVLQEKDPAYILNFPLQEIEFNPGLVPNQRPARNPL